MQTGRLLTSLALALGLAGSAIALSAQQPPATPAAARAFLDEANRELLRLLNAANRAGWTQNTYITVDTEQMLTEANAALVSASTRYAKGRAASTPCRCRRPSAASSTC